MSAQHTGPRRRCLILDPGLRVSSGHHLNAARQIADEARGAGFSVRVLASRFASDAVIAMLSAEPVFTNSAYSVGDGTQAAYDRYARTTFDALIAGLGPDLSPPDLIVMPTADAALAEALTGYLALFPKEARPGVIAWLLLPRDFLRMNTPEGDLRGFRGLCAALPPGRLRVFVETEAVQASFAGDFSVPIDVAPSPSTALQSAGPSERAPGQPLTFSAFGHIRPGKGFELLPEAIGVAKRARPDIAFRIHATPGTSHGAEADLVRAMAAAAEDVEVIGRELDGAEYEALLSGADIALLPYDPEIYRERGSGIFNECEQLGKPVIATAGCSFATKAAAGGRAILADTYSPEALAGAIIEAADQFPALSAACLAHARDLAAGPGGQKLNEILTETARDPGASASAPDGAFLRFARARFWHGLRVVARMGEIRKARKHGGV